MQIFYLTGLLKGLENWRLVFRSAPENVNRSSHIEELLIKFG